MNSNSEEIITNISDAFPMKKRYKKLLNSAKNRNISVNLNLFFYEEMLQMGCIFCGENLLNKPSPCLDRIDSKKGYTEDNVQPCCKTCNIAKQSMSTLEFCQWMRKVHDHTPNDIKVIRTKRSI